MVFHEAPHKLLRTLRDMLEAWGDRDIALCRELTKLHEQFIRCKLSQAIALYEESAPKGEFVLVIAGAPQTQEVPEADLDGALALVAQLREGGMKLKYACRIAGEQTGFSKNELYQAALAQE